MDEKIILWRTAAKVLGAAFLQLFPKAKLIEGDASPVGFTYDFFFPYEEPTDLLFVLEERMKGMVLESKEITLQEMIASNAISYLTHFHKHFDIPLENDKSLVSIVRIGDFVDIVQGSVLSNTKDLLCFSLLGKKREGDRLKIWGVADVDRESLKEDKKRLDRYQKKNHVVFGEDLQLFTLLDGECVWSLPQPGQE